jgi:hypothetical protein
LFVNPSFTGSLSITSGTIIRLRNLDTGYAFSTGFVSITSPLILYSSLYVSGSQTPSFTGSITFTSTTPNFNLIMSAYNSVVVPIIVDIPANSTFQNNRRIICQSLTMYRGTLFSSSTSTFSPAALILPSDNTLNIDFSDSASITGTNYITISGSGTVNSNYYLFNFLSSMASSMFTRHRCFGCY